MNHPFAISRRSFLAGLGAGLALKGLGCGGRPETNPGLDAGATPDFRIDRRFPLPSYLTADLAVYRSRILGVVTPTLGGGNGDTDNYLFEFDPNDPSPAPSMTRIDLPGGPPLSQVVPLPSERSVVTAHSGFYVEDVNQPQGRRLVPFLPEYDVSVVGGAVATEDKFLIAASSAILQNGWLRFNSGRIFVYDLDSNGDVQGTPPRFVATSGANPTGLVLRRNGSELVVLNSGGFVDRREPSIDIIDLQGERIIKKISSLPGGMTAQVSPRLALSPDGKIAIVGTATHNTDTIGRIFFIDLENDRTLLESELPGTKFHHTGIQADGDFVYISDFFSEQLTVLDWGGKLFTDEDLEFGFSQAGPAMFLGGKLFQSLPETMVVISR